MIELHNTFTKYIAAPPSDFGDFAMLRNHEPKSEGVPNAHLYSKPAFQPNHRSPEESSISMRSLVDSAIEAVNRLLAEQKGINPQSRFTLTSFGHVVRPIIENIALADGPLIGRDLYRADGGSTSLNVRHP